MSNGSDNLSLDLIETKFRDCLTIFHEVQGTFQRAEEKPLYNETDFETIKREVRRFTDWGRNVGAHRSDRTSLEYRVRNSSYIKQEVLGLIEDLKVALEEISLVISGERLTTASLELYPNYDDDPDDDEISEKVELEECLLNIKHVVSCLYKFTITLQNPAPTDKLQKWAAIDVSEYSFNDIQHVQDKFPRGREFLHDRLGKANTRRRQILRYNKIHNAKISDRFPIIRQGFSKDADKMDHDGITGIVPLGGGMLSADYFGSQEHSFKTDISVAPTQTTLETIKTYLFNSPSFNRPHENVDKIFDDAESVTSFASSVNEGSTILRVPPPPDDACGFDGTPFICPYCFSQEIINNDHIWKGHVYKDLRPYICTFPTCATADKLYPTRNVWFQHEVTHHRREWYCNAPKCQKVYKTREEFVKHLHKRHQKEYQKPSGAFTVDQCERATAGMQECPLCLERFTLARLRGHLGRHMQQVALFVLPESRVEDYEQDDDDEGSDGDDEDEKDDDKDAQPDQPDQNSQASQNAPAPSYRTFFPSYRTFFPIRRRNTPPDQPDQNSQDSQDSLFLSYIPKRSSSFATVARTVKKFRTKKQE